MKLAKNRRMSSIHNRPRKNNAVATVIVLVSIAALTIGWLYVLSVIFPVSTSIDPKNVTKIIEQQQSKIDSKKEFSVGQMAHFDALQVTVTKSAFFTPTESYAYASDGHRFVALTMKVKNTSDDDVLVGPSTFSILDKEEVRTASYVQAKNPIKKGVLPPQSEVTGTLVYEVSVGDHQRKLLFTTNAYDIKTLKTKLLRYTLVLPQPN